MTDTTQSVFEPRWWKERAKRIARPDTVAALAWIGLLTAIALAVRLNAASAGFFLLVGVLLVASRKSLIASTAAALAATLAYNYFFFPPTRTFVIEDPANWIALAAFLVTSLVANRLLVRERLQAERAKSSREQVEALYAMSVSLLRGGESLDEIGQAAARYLERIGVRSGGVILFGASPQQQRVLGWTGAPPSDEIEDLAAGAGRHGRTVEIPSRWGRDHCVPLLIRARARAVLVARGEVLSQAALDSAANLLSFAIERAEFQQESARIEALRQANEWKTSLLQAVSHDLKSPLTVLAVESEALERDMGAGARKGAVRAIREETARLHRRIDSLLTLARLEAGAVEPRVEPTPPADLFRLARESLPTLAASHAFRTSVADDAGDLLVDPSLALEIVVNLIENAARAAPAGPIELSARPSPERGGRLWVEVRDRGSGLPPEQERRIRSFDPGAAAGGLGIELARTLATFSGGTVEWFEREGGGTVARLDAPAAPLPELGAH